MPRVVNLRRAVLLLCLGCSASTDNDDGHAAIVDLDRPEHFFDHPFPSAALVDEDGEVDLSGYPVSGVPSMLPVIEGWRDRAATATDGFANGGSVYFRFEGPIDVPQTTEGLPTDSVLLIDLDTLELHPLDLHFTRDPLGDPTLAPNLLALSPQLGHLPASGARLAAIVMASAGATQADTRLHGDDDELLDALSLAGVQGEVAVATIFRTQDATGQIRALAEAADAWRASQDSAPLELKRVIHISYAQGTTPSGNDATVFTARFEDGTEEQTYIAPLNEEEGNHELDLLSDWPMAVYQGHLAVPNFSGPRAPCRPQFLGPG